MKLCYEYEAARSNLMNRDPSPSLDVCFQELLREEQRFATQTIFQQDKMHDNAIAYAALHGKNKGRDMRHVQCFSCKEYGHIVVNCAKKYCNCCKKSGHIIKECPTRPQNHQANHVTIANQTVVGSTTVNRSTLTPETVQ
ncbi:Retrovirus-related Pol polyprotein from transposon TNT 1-94 [Melia azedarach]|uniref:Retrovirus-related Pol polyprotein from transposon TNT 1-94 n=1 Tax=Melia azedarach TaxID=155640 RepID=A0ACC1WUF2_MELAZ|nr:Retrovirus-related Pol polyprotein from transposon TNT 1-94 [Melia azedarach]